MGQTICEVTEELIVAFHHFAEQTGGFDHQLAHRLLNYLRANYATSEIDDFGGPIMRRDIASGANIEMRAGVFGVGTESSRTETPGAVTK